MSTYFSWYRRMADSAIGTLLMTGDGQALTALDLHAAERGTAIPRDWHQNDAMFAEARAQLDAYFAGQRRDFDLPLAPAGTPFQQGVWRALQAIPYGLTESYGALARRVGKPQAARAVGLANGRNPIPIIIPCHRVIGADGSLTGYGGGLARKRWLLAHEAAVRAAA